MAEPTFLLSPEASDDLLAIGNYIAEQSGLLSALDVVERISRTISTLAYSPNIGRRRPDLDGIPHLFPIPPWIVLYELDPDLAGIHILRVYDGRRDLGRIFRAYKRPSRTKR